MDSVSAVVATPYPLDNQAAEVFAQCFYQALGRGASLIDSLRSVRSGLSAADDEDEAYRMVLYLRANQRDGSCLWKAGEIAGARQPSMPDHPAIQQPANPSPPPIDFLQLVQVFTECESLKIKESRIALLNFLDPPLRAQCDNYINDAPRDFAMNLVGLIKKARQNGTVGE